MHVFGQRYAEGFRFEKGEQGFMGVQVGTGRIAETVSRSLIILGNRAVQVLRLFAANTKFVSHHAMPVLSQGIGHFHAETMQHEIIVVSVGLVQSSRLLPYPASYGHDEKSRNVAASLGWFEIISNAKMRR